MKREPKVAQAAKNQAAMSDEPLAKKNLTEAVEKMDKLLPEQVSVVFFSSSLCSFFISTFDGCKIRAAQEVAKSGGAAEEPKKKLNKNIAVCRSAIFLLLLQKKNQKTCSLLSLCPFTFPPF